MRVSGRSRATAHVPPSAKHNGRHEPKGAPECAVRDCAMAKEVEGTARWEAARARTPGWAGSQGWADFEHERHKEVWSGIGSKRRRGLIKPQRWQWRGKRWTRVLRGARQLQSRWGGGSPGGGAKSTEKKEKKVQISRAHMHAHVRSPNMNLKLYESHFRKTLFPLRLCAKLCALPRLSRVSLNPFTCPARLPHAPR